MAACAILAIAWPRRRAPRIRSTTRSSSSPSASCRTSSTARPSCSRGRSAPSATSASSSTSRPRSRSASCSRRTSPRRKVADPVFLGGPVSPEVIFALVQGKQSPGGRSIKILDDLYLAIDSEVVDHVIEKQSRAGALLRRHGAVAPGRAARRDQARPVVRARRQGRPRAAQADRRACGKSSSAAPSGRPTDLGNSGTEPELHGCAARS